MLIVSNSFYQFLIENKDSNRIARFLHSAINYEMYGYKAVKLMLTVDKINYLTLRDDGTLSYLPAGKEHIVTENGTWARSSRQNGSPGKMIRKVLTPKALKLFKDADFEAFANSYKAACDSECKRFEIWDNKRIPEAYDMKRESGGGTLNDSCMNGDGNYLDMYYYCPHARILVMLNSEGRLAGRALLWTVDDGKTLMDRVYVAQDHYYDMFLDYADKNGFIRKVRYKTYDSKNEFVLNGEVFTKYYTIRTATTHEYYPYIDTFSYGCDGYLTNNENDDTYRYNNTDGSRDGDERYYCEHSGDWYSDEDDVRYIERGRYRGSYIHRDYAVYVETYGEYMYSEDDNVVCINGCFYHTDDDDICEVNGDYVMKEDAEWSNYHEEYIMSDDAIWSEHHESYIKTDEAVKTPDGAVWHKDDIEEC